MSPGNQGVDAIGLMKQLREQTAGAFADAQEVLGDETPETIMKEKCAINQEGEKENNYETSSKKHNSISASVLMVWPCIFTRFITSLPYLNEYLQELARLCRVLV